MGCEVITDLLFLLLGPCIYNSSGCFYCSLYLTRSLYNAA